MIVVLKKDANKEKQDKLIDWLKGMGLGIHISVGEYQTVLGLIGDTSKVDMDLIGSLDIVDSVKRVTDTFKCVNRQFHPDDTVVNVGDVKIGGGNFAMIAGPCSVESEAQIVEVAKAVKAAGANLLRGGAFKPRTSPYDFQGLKGEGLELLKIARKETGLPIVTEIMSVSDLPLLILFEDALCILEVHVAHADELDVVIDFALAFVGNAVDVSVSTTADAYAEEFDFTCLCGFLCLLSLAEDIDGSHCKSSGCCGSCPEERSS